MQKVIFYLAFWTAGRMRCTSSSHLPGSGHQPTMKGLDFLQTRNLTPPRVAETSLRPEYQSYREFSEKQKSQTSIGDNLNVLV
jgi:hypothetical protein